MWRCHRVEKWRAGGASEKHRPSVCTGDAPTRRKRVLRVCGWCWSESKVNERQREGSAPLSLVPGASRGAGRPVATVPGNRWLARSPRKEHAWTRVRAKGDIARSVDNFIAEQPRLGEPSDRPSYRHFRFHFVFLPCCLAVDRIFFKSSMDGCWWSRWFSHGGNF